MTVSVATTIFFRLMLILVIVGNRKFALAAEDVCQGKNSEHLAQFLEDSELKKVTQLILYIKLIKLLACRKIVFMILNIKLFVLNVAVVA